jgi:lysophospholipase L1-like esterase
LQDLLLAKGHKDIVVINEGFPASNTETLLDRHMSLLEKYQPQIVLFMVGINDPWNLPLNRDWRSKAIGLLRHSRVFNFSYLAYVNIFKFDKAQPNFVEPPNEAPLISVARKQGELFRGQ